MKKIDEKILEGVNPLIEFLGVKRSEDLKDKIAQMILDKVEEELDNAFREIYLIEPEIVNDLGNEVYEEVKGIIKQKLEAKYMALADEAISKLSIKD